MWKLKKYKTAPTYEEYKWGEYEEKIIYCEDSSEFTITPLNYWEGTIEVTSASTYPTYIFGPEKNIDSYCIEYETRWHEYTSNILEIKSINIYELNPDYFINGYGKNKANGLIKIEIKRLPN